MTKCHSKTNANIALQSVPEEQGLSGLNNWRNLAYIRENCIVSPEDQFMTLDKQYEKKRKETFTFTIRSIICIYKIDGGFKSAYGVD